MECSNSVENKTSQIFKVGVLAIQGDFKEHLTSLNNAAHKLKSHPDYVNTDVEVIEIRNVNQMNDELHGLIIPGGESTVLSKHLKLNGFQEKLKSWTQNKNKFTWGTCAGLILLSETIKDGSPKNNIAKIGGIDITCLRNAFGRQNESFESKVTVTDKQLLQGNENDFYHGVFIRAPGIVSVDNKAVDVLCRLPGMTSQASDVIGVRQNNIMATTFHPELTDDTKWHEYFLFRVFEISKNK